jgi:putative inorganic carbon (hco3(-)) transporter
MMSFLPDLKRHSLVLGIVLVYIVTNTIFTLQEIYLLNLIPLVILFIYLAIARLDIFYFIIVLLTPISVQLIEFFPSLKFDFAIPTEPMLFGVMLLLIYRTIQSGEIDRQIMNHPVTWAILLNLFWLLMTSVTSVMPLVSFKFLFARLWFLSVYFFLAILIFRNTSNIRVFIWCYTLPLLVVIFYAIGRHLKYGIFDKDAAHFVMNPFFRDHTSYGAILAMLFFAVGGILFGNKSGIIQRICLVIIWLLISVALILSYTRAAWISVIFSVGVLLLMMMKIRLRLVLFMTSAIIILLILQRTNITRRMERNRQTSSATLTEHVQSISNITTDDSNLERINRWNSALRMFGERPVFGWGPGTYMFKYAPFQISGEKTSISTNFGDKGNAHSEYIGPLAESGLLGSLSFILICLTVLFTGFRVYSRLEDKRLKQVILGCILGFITYLIHGLLNNFLDTDKASALFWGFAAVFVALDLSLKELNPQN